MERPAQAKPKTKEELKKIERELEKMNARVKEKIKLEEREKLQKSKQQLTREEFIRNSTKIWEKEIIPEWDTKKRR